jgi:nitrate reductase gamma subunit
LIFQWFTIIFGWASILIFVFMAAYKFYRIATLPLNLRWEVYPVPHETKDRRSYGGSYMEQVDWARKPRSSSLLAELGEMGSEIFLLNRVRKHNPYHLWPLSMAMHWGIYLLLLWIGLLAVTHWMTALASLTVVVGVSALVLGTCGAIGLIVKRATDKNLARYTAPADYFNLVFLAAIFGLGLISWLVDPHFSQHQSYILSLIFFKPTSVSPTVVAMFFILQAFAIYMPFSKLIHYIMKHFTFTEILWDDEFKAKSSSKDRRITRQLSYVKQWSGSHIGRGKTWLEDAQEISVAKEWEK